MKRNLSNFTLHDDQISVEVLSVGIIEQCNTRARIQCIHTNWDEEQCYREQH